MKQKSKMLKILLLGILFQITPFSNVLGQSKSEKIDEVLSLYHEFDQFNGSILIAENGKVIFKKGYGLANMEWDVPNKPDTKFRIGSVTKQFTALLTLQLVEQGKIKLDETINAYLPNYPRTGGDKITIQHLLTHSSGIPRFKLEKIRDSYTPDELLNLWSDSNLDFTPGEKFSYSNTGYFLLGVIIEKVSGKTYEQALQENIFTPLKMNNTGYDHKSKILKNRASGYIKDQNNKYINAPYIDMSIPFAAGSMYSTVEDMYLWDQALYTEQLLSSKYRDLLFTNQIPALGRHYAYGWFNSKFPIGSTKDSIAVIEHSGGVIGFGSHIVRVPSDKNLIVLLDNTQRGNLKDIIFAVNGILYDRPFFFPKKSLANMLFAAILKNGLDRGLEEYHSLKKSDQYALKENEMNSLGYRLTRSGKMDEALEVFKLNAEAFPESGNAYDSLAENYLIQGNNELALKNYKKAFELNPNNNNAKENIETIELALKSTN